MALVESTMVPLGTEAHNFKLDGTDGKAYSLTSFTHSKVIVIVFMCNHCPYVKAIFDRLILDLAELKKIGINAVAISSNDPTNYPEDSYVNMKKISELKMFDFPYLFDESQEVARAYNAICTPDFFGFNESLELQYRGRFRELKDLKPIKNGDSDLKLSMKMIAQTQKGPDGQIPSLGCNIKWFN